MGLREQVVAEGKKWINKLHYSQTSRYNFRVGGSADCSSYYQYCLMTGANVDPGNWTGNQMTKGREISRSQLLPGDAVFYPGHVVLYIGDGRCLSHGGPDWSDMGPVQKSIDYRNDIIQYRSYIKEEPTPVNNDYIFSVSQVQQGSNGNSVLLLQEILISRGYDTGGLDRIFGSLTDAALKSYQTLRGLDVDGICGPITWSDLLALEKSSSNYIARNSFMGSNGTSVLLVQEILKSREYYTGYLDRGFGILTETAVKSYQTDRKGASGTIDGAVGVKTWADLLGL